ncbi:MAG: response regulator transcription factor [Rhodospirillales bacterium]|nr:response regulator transcription factor [Rhodospirillales bacterium]MCB9973234.1 response regulator transcription factor [Rhodospirillales bacterium]MCB9980736.1 response regulator transcription factor [Rhodospirillales bacterium]
MKLLVADDHTLFRDALLQYIQRADPQAEVLLANDVQGTFSYLEADEYPDVILLDYKMPGMSGLKGLEQIRKSYPEIKVALMSGLIEPAEIKKAIEMGIVGYFPKTMSGKAFIKAIQLVLTGERFFSFDSEAHSLMPSYYGDMELPSESPETKHPPSHNMSPQDDVRDGTDVARRLARLSPRELEVLSYLIQGDANKEIANKLDLQVVTIKLHVRGICRKLGAKNRTQAALIAQECDLQEFMKA